jgi:superfamily II DNA or RNA helicase
VRLVFDRGTVLVLATGEGELQDIPGLLWDPRVAAYRAPGHRHQALLAELRRRGIAVVDEVGRAIQPLDVGNWRPISLRSYQEAALSAWELASKRGLVVLPTGSGKTRVALAAMARCGLAALCLVPTRVLLDQWLRQLGAVYTGALGRFGDGVQELQPITVATFESAYRQMQRLGNRFDLLIVDEAHHFGNGLRDEALEMSIAKARLGLTATPLRGGGAGSRLDELIGPVVYELAIGDLAGRFLASFDIITLSVDLSDEERAHYETWMSRFRAVHSHYRRLAPDASWVDFARAASRSSEGRAGLDALRRARKLVAFTQAKRQMLRTLLERHRQARVLVFTADNDAAYAVAREHLVMPLTCDIGAAERREVLERFRRGELTTLVSARVLNEGLDVPDADVAIVVGGALGEREHVQRVGRLLRPAPDKRARVYELVSRQTIEVAQARRRREGLAPRVAPSL